jgi:hypothetical protein
MFIFKFFSIKNDSCHFFKATFDNRIIIPYRVKHLFPVLFLFILGCQNVLVPEPPARFAIVDGTVAVTGVSLDYTEIALTLANPVWQLNPVINPVDAANQGISWVSMNSLVASVDNSGLVTALSAGSTAVMVITQDGNKTAVCAVNVSALNRENVSGFTVIPGDGELSFSWTNPDSPDIDYVLLSVAAEESPAIEKQINKTDSPNNTYTFTELSNGVPYTVRIGVHYIDDTYSGETAKTVIPVPAVSQMDLSALIAAPVTGETADNAVITEGLLEFERVERNWQNSNGSPYMGTFEAGRVYRAVLEITVKPDFTFAGAGNFFHSAAQELNVLTSADYQSAVITIGFPATGEDSRPAAVTGVSLDYTQLSLTLVNPAQQLTPAISPPNATNQTLSWTSTNPSVASVNGSGLVTAHSPGSAVIMALTQDGGKTAACVVYVTTTGLANVTNFAAMPGNAEAVLTWTNPPVAEFESVVISSSPAAGSLSTQKTINKADSTNHTYTVTGLSNGTAYTIKIKARYSGGSESEETSKTVTPATMVTATLLDSLITAPVTGGSANSSAITTGLNEFARVERAWKKADDSPHTGAFQAGNVYKAVLTITAKPAYTFFGVEGFAHTGAANVTYMHGADYKSTVVTIAFPVTAGVTVSGKITGGGINLSDATVQLKNGTADYLAPVTTGSDGTYSINGVAAGTYTILVSKPNYSSAVISSFGVSTANVPNKNATLNLAVSQLNLDNLIDSPLPGSGPDTSADVSWANSQYTAGSPTWRTLTDTTVSSSAVFEPGTAYKVTITLNAATGWSFSGLSSDNFSYSGASNVSVTIPTTGASATVTIEFPTVRWVDVDVNDKNQAGATLASRLQWVREHGRPGENYTITVTADETIAPQTLSVIDNLNLVNTNITLKGSGGERIIDLSTNGSLFTLTAFNSTNKITLTLDADITLRGRPENNASLVTVKDNAILVMQAGSRITGNTYSGSGANGSGVHIAAGAFTMNGGEISGNNANGNGGGVYSTSASASFIMNGGIISGNTAKGSGGGVYSSSATSFTMRGGIIRDNTAKEKGGGIYSAPSSSASASFLMNGGIISGNTAAGGGGIYFTTTYSGTFTKNGGVIYGNTDPPALPHTPGSNENTATDGIGHAVLSGDGRKRDSDAPSGQNMSSTLLGAAGGWE